MATIAFYGPDNSRASKVAVGVVTRAEGEAEVLERWFSERADVRFDAGIGREILAFLERHAVKSVVLSDGVIGCPHEEGIDYPEGQICPQCPYWATRDRWTGDLLHEQ